MNKAILFILSFSFYNSLVLARRSILSFGYTTPHTRDSSMKHMATRGGVRITLVKYPILDSRSTLATPIVSALVAGYDRHTSNIVVSPQKILNIAQSRDTL